MADDPVPPAAHTPVVNEVTVRDVVSEFLDSRRGRVSANTHRGYGFLLKRVVREFGDVRVRDLKAAVVEQWLAGLPLSSSTRSDIAGVMGSAFNRAEREQRITRNPLRGMKHPPAESRGAKSLISKATHSKLLAVARPELSRLLVLLRETGARPSELTGLTAENLDVANRLAILKRHKTWQSTGRPRHIFLSQKAVRLLDALAKQYPTGPLLRNSVGNPWTREGVTSAMRRAKQRAGVKATAYGYRHTYATDALAAGVPDAQVAALLGHSSTAMLHKHYSHLSEQTRVLAAAAKTVR